MCSLPCSFLKHSLLNQMINVTQPHVLQMLRIVASSFTECIQSNIYTQLEQIQCLVLYVTTISAYLVLPSIYGDIHHTYLSTRDGTILWCISASQCIRFQSVYWYCKLTTDASFVYQLIKWLLQWIKVIKQCFCWK